MNACRYGKTNNCSVRAALKAPTYILWSTTAHQFKTPKGFRCGCRWSPLLEQNRHRATHTSISPRGGARPISLSHRQRSVCLPGAQGLGLEKGNRGCVPPLSWQDPPPSPLSRAAAQRRVALFRSTTLQRERAPHLGTGRAEAERAGR